MQPRGGAAHSTRATHISEIQPLTLLLGDRVLLQRRSTDFPDRFIRFIRFIRLLRRLGGAGCFGRVLRGLQE